MTKYAGKVGYAIQSEKAPGVWVDEIVERKMRGDVIGSSSSFRPGESVNDDIVLGHRISLVGDPYAYENFTGLRYVTYLGVKWKVTGIEIQRPRMIVTVGDIYVG